MNFQTAQYCLNIMHVICIYYYVIIPPPSTSEERLFEFVLTSLCFKTRMTFITRAVLLIVYVCLGSLLFIVTYLYCKICMLAATHRSSLRSITCVVRRNIFLSYVLAGFLCQLLVYRQAHDVRQSKIGDALGNDYTNRNNKDFRHRSNSRERVRRDSSDIGYDRGFGEADEVSIDKPWSGLSSILVSICGAQLMRNHSNILKVGGNQLFDIKHWSQGRWAGPRCILFATFSVCQSVYWCLHTVCIFLSVSSGCILSVNDFQLIYFVRHFYLFCMIFMFTSFLAQRSPS